MPTRVSTSIMYQAGAFFPASIITASSAGCAANRLTRAVAAAST